MMRITNVHVRFWLQHAGPDWARSISVPYLPQATIDDCVNAHVVRNSVFSPREHFSEADDLLKQLRVVRKQGDDLLSFLHAVYNHPGVNWNPARRAALAKKWAIQIESLRGVKSLWAPKV